MTRQINISATGSRDFAGGPALAGFGRPVREPSARSLAGRGRKRYVSLCRQHRLGHCFGDRRATDEVVATATVAHAMGEGIAADPRTGRIYIFEKYAPPNTLQVLQ